MEVLALKMGRGQEPRGAASLKAGKGKETFTVEHPDGMQFCPHFAFSPGRLCLDF